MQLSVAEGEGRAQLFEDVVGERLGMLPLAERQDAELVAGEARQHIVLSEYRADSMRRLLQCQVAAAVTEAVVDPLKVVQVHHQHGQRLAFLARGQDLGDHLGEGAAVEQIGQRVVMGHRVELVLGLVECLALLAEALFGPAGGDAGDDYQQGDQTDCRGEDGMLAAVTAEWGGVLQHVGGDCQGQRMHAGVVHRNDRRTHQQAAEQALPVLMPALAGAEVKPQHQRGDRGADGDQHRGGEGQRCVVERGQRADRRHSGVVHGGNADAGGRSGHRVLRNAEAIAAEQMHHHIGHGYGDQQRKQGNAMVVADVQRCAEGQHADEMHRPDAAAQGERTDPTPQFATARAAAAADPLGQRQGGERRRAGDQVGKNDQQRVVTVAKQSDLVGGKLGKQESGHAAALEQFGRPASWR